VSLFDPPVPINHNHILENFESGEPLLDEWLKKRAKGNLELGASRTYVICPKDSQVVIGFFSLNMGQMLANETMGSMRRNMPTHIPAIVLGRLAIDKNWQGQGLGRALIFEAMRRAFRASEDVAARLLIVHTIAPKAEDFYKHHGFTRLPVEAPMLAIDIVKYRALN
jgi:GNAT superfamily N-acetyltransferase